MTPIAPLLIVLTLIFGLLSTHASQAAPTLSQGYDAFEQGDVTTAVQIWTTLAEQGDTTAQVNLGQLYRQGRGVAQDDRAAVKWYSMAAQQGSETAQFNLMIMQKEGRASDEDLALAFAGQGEDIESAGIPQTGAAPDTQTDSAAGAVAVTSPSGSPATTATSEIGVTPSQATVAVSSPTGTSASAAKRGAAATPGQAAQVSSSADSMTPAKPAPTARQEARPAPTGEAVAATMPAARIPSNAQGNGEAWLWQTPARHYLLQIVASSNRARVKEYAERNLGDFQSQLHIAHTSNQGRNWFLLLMGPFATLGEADATLQRLPPATLKDKPWARSVQSIQKAVAIKNQD